MADSPSIMSGLVASLQEMASQIFIYLPRVATALLLLIGGWLVARLVRMLVVRLIGRLDVFWQRLISRRGLVQLQQRHPPTRIVGELVFWFLMLVSLTIATEILGLGIFGAWLKEIVTYLPLAAVGLLIVLVGFVVSSLTRDLIASASDSTGMLHGELLGRVSQIVILFIAIVLGIDQIGIDIMFLSVITGIVLAAMLGGIALAFGMGARTHVSNIIAANQLREFYRVGDIIRVGDNQGRVTNISSSRVIIETESGSVDIPAKVFDEQITLIIEKGGD